MEKNLYSLSITSCTMNSIAFAFPLFFVFIILFTYLDVFFCPSLHFLWSPHKGGSMLPSFIRSSFDRFEVRTSARAINLDARWYNAKGTSPAHSNWLSTRKGLPSAGVYAPIYIE